MLLTKSTEGEAEFAVPAAGKTCKTWYKVFGNLKSGVRPLICLHGGPGVGHDYMLAMQDMTTKYNIPVVLYDQLGTGLSTHLPEKRLDTTFWTVQLFLDELDNLLEHLEITDYNVIGHSWGGMLGASHAINQPKGLNRLIISDSPASMELWVKACDRLRDGLPQEVQDTLSKHEADGTTDSEEYEGAVDVFYAKHLCRVQPMPEDLQKGLDWIKKDDTVYYTMNGPSEFYVTGSLKTWTVVDQVHKIQCPTLLLNGHYDEAQDSVVEPYFQNIPQVKWFTFAESSHMPLLEEREKYMQVVSNFLS